MEINVHRDSTDFEDRLKAVEDKLDVNNAATAQILQLVSTFKGGMQFLGWLGVGAKWVGSIAAAVAAVLGMLHFYGGNK